jgi:CheY-like chemotaxis protein
MLTLLIVDDSPHGRLVIEAMLVNSSYNFVFAVDGKDAYEKAVNHKPDLIILDVMMPIYDGIQVTQMIRENSEIANIPILIATALDDNDTRNRALKAGANEVIVKPLSKNLIQAAVNKLAEGIADRQV